MRHPAAIATLVILLAACQAEQPDPMPNDAADACGAAALQGLLGQELTAFKALPDTASTTRIIGPDTAVTMDYRPERLNIEHDKDDIITRIYCG
ncbi:MAG: hypothetical protein JJT99_00315 [Rhodobacteraceae bacterium]|nr:hypothetical protein [Paracoccaceae bacterium]